MAQTSALPPSAGTLAELLTLLWGNNIKQDLFTRWNQGLVFSEEEPTALVQQDGGPCAVIVPVQAYLLKQLLFAQGTPGEAGGGSKDWRHPSVELRSEALGRALTDILTHAQSSNEATLLYSCPSPIPVGGPGAPAPPSPGVHATEAEGAPTSSAALHGRGGLRICEADFHSSLRVRSCASALELRTAVQELLSVFQADCGILLLLYSIVLTKGVERIKSEVADLGEPLIDSIHGHGSQSLINLLLTGTAASHVWDNVKDVSGLKLQGISSQSEIGFLTLLEHLRYCEVGWYLKNPIYPIWLLGSETHLTILFSQDRTLVGEESALEKARRLFSQFDEEGRGFIAVSSLGDLMQRLDLVFVPEYVQIMAEKLDPEQLGVITLNGFLDEFFAASNKEASGQQRFSVYHYNGLPRSCPNNKVVYLEASCLLMDMPELQLISDFSTIKTCLLTKWPTIDLSWQNNIVPSMN